MMKSERQLQLFQSQKQIIKQGSPPFGYNNHPHRNIYEKRNFGFLSKGRDQYQAHMISIFREVVSGLNLRKKQGDSSLIEQPSVKIPRTIVNILYRQNIRNYNPYIAALEQLEQQKSLDALSKEQISKLCYIGLAKSFIKTKKYSLAANYSTVNVLIRTYMRDKMEEEVKSKEENYDSVIFVPTSELALSFSPKKMPRGVEELMSAQQYSKVIGQVNIIIQNEYVKYKTSNTLSISESVNGKILLWVLSMLCLIFFIDKSAAILPFLFVSLLLYVGYLVYESWEKLAIIVESKNTNQTIIEKLSRYFESIKTDMIEWKVGRDFYWLELHYIKKKKRNFNVND